MEALASLVVLAACIGVGWALMRLRRRVGHVEQKHEDHEGRLREVEERQRGHGETIEPLRHLAQIIDAREEAPASRRGELETEGPRSVRRDRIK